MPYLCLVHGDKERVDNTIPLDGCTHDHFGLYPDDSCSSTPASSVQMFHFVFAPKSWEMDVSDWMGARDDKRADIRRAMGMCWLAAYANVAYEKETKGDSRMIYVTVHDSPTVHKEATHVLSLPDGHSKFSGIITQLGPLITSPFEFVHSQQNASSNWPSWL